MYHAAATAKDGGTVAEAVSVTTGGATNTDRLSFRRAASRFATGIAIVSCLDDADQPQGMTINSFTSISDEPATVLVSLRLGRTNALIRKRGGYGISVLTAAQTPLSQHFAGKPQIGIDVAWTMKAKIPVLRQALAWFSCEIDATMQIHDHTLFFARVVDCDHTSGDPLVFFASEYHAPRVA